MNNDKQLIYERFLAVTENTRQNPVIDSDGTKRWYNENGQLHREDGPAVERADGRKEWHVNGKFYNTIPEWVEALFEFKKWTPEFLASKGKDYDKLVNIYAQKMIDKYE